MKEVDKLKSETERAQKLLASVPGPSEASNSQPYNITMFKMSYIMFRATKQLFYLTWALIVLTIILTVSTVMLVIK
jgi:hypothetical protein